MPPVAADSKLVLVVDDSPAVTGFIERTLTDNDRYRVKVVAEKEQALKQAHALQPAVILIDATSETIDASFICHFLLEDGYTGQWTIVLMEGYRRDGDTEIQQIVEQYDGVRSVLKKPFSAEQLVEAMDEATRAPAPKLNLPTKGSRMSQDTANSFKDLLNQGSVLCYSVANAQGKVIEADGKDCGELSEPSAYFCQLASKIGDELGLEGLSELHITAEQCRLVSVKRPDGTTIDVLAGNAGSTQQIVNSALTL